MKKYVYLLFFMSVLSVFTMSNRKGRASVSQLGSTGAPGDDATVCQSCHNGPITVGIQIVVMDVGDTITSYVANKTYRIHVRVNHLGGNVPKAHGFQMTLLNAPKGQNGPNLKDLAIISSNVKLTTPRNGRLYAEQNDRSVDSLFEIQWTAPLSGSGPVTIYAAGSGVNANDSNSGDGGSKSALQLDEKIVSFTEANGNSTIQIFPNPFTDKFWIQGFTEELLKIEIVDLFGRNIMQRNLNEKIKYIDLSHLNDGIYFAKLINHQDKLIRTQKLMKRTLRP